MTNIISVNFKKDNETSIALQSMLDGEELKEAVKDYILDLKDDNLKPVTPLGRKEPHTVILDFVIWYLGDLDGNEDNYTLTRTPTNLYTYNLETDTWE